MESTPTLDRPPRRQSAGKRRHVAHDGPRTVSAVVRRPDRKARTRLARQRRHNELVRQLALDLGFQLAAVTLAERGVLHQCATLMSQVELAQDTLIRGDGIIDPDVCIRLSSEARRLLAGLRKRAGKQELPSPPRGHRFALASMPRLSPRWRSERFRSRHQLRAPEDRNGADASVECGQRVPWWKTYKSALLQFCEWKWTRSKAKFWPATPLI